MMRAMIFDLDGTLVQTEELKALSYAKAALSADMWFVAVTTPFTHQGVHDMGLLN